MATLLAPLLLLLLLLLSSHATAPAPPPLFRQCDARWGEATMGTPGNGERSTICREGCAMSCVAMALASHGFAVPCPPPRLRCPPDPGTLNTWLQTHGGYHCAGGDCNNLVLTAPDTLTGGRMRLIGEWDISAVASSAKMNNTTSLVRGVTTGEVVFLAHVHNPEIGGHPVDHFVLLDSVDLASNSFGVRDPYCACSPCVPNTRSSPDRRNGVWAPLPLSLGPGLRLGSLCAFLPASLGAAAEQTTRPPTPSRRLQTCCSTRCCPPRLWCRCPTGCSSSAIRNGRVRRWAAAATLSARWGA